MKSAAYTIPLALVISCLMLSGCGSRGPKTVPVSGIVTMNGKPLPTGSLMFVPEDRSLPSEGVNIADGKFQFRAKPGKNKVEIRATRPPPGVAPANVGVKMPPGWNWVQYIPVRYNSQTELRAEVSDGGKNEFEFDLKSNP